MKRVSQMEGWWVQLEDSTKFYNDRLTTFDIRDGFITKGELKLANKKSSMKEISQVERH